MILVKEWVLTYKSISDEIKARIAELEGTELFLLPPSMRSDPTVRELFVSREVKEAIFPPWPDNRDGYRHMTFRADLDAFTTHQFLRVSEQPFDKSPNTDISRIHPVDREVWDFRSLEPPGIRCFGRFGGFNLFIALTWEYRENIFEGDDWLEPNDWDAERDRFEQKWREFFGDLKLFRGDRLDDYLSNYHAV